MHPNLPMAPVPSLALDRARRVRVSRGQKRGQKTTGSVSRGAALRLLSARELARFLERATGIEPATFSLGMRYARVSRRFEGTA
jgi:hypothetical protein